jgi:TatD DNase family protein
MALELFDSHCHLDAEAFAPDLPAVLERAAQAGVTRLVTIGAGYGVASAGRAVALAESHANIWATVGIHPHDAATDASVDELRTLASHTKVVAIGETGLDFHYDFAPRAEQRRWFELQIALAQEVKKPLVIHSREAGEECIAMLKANGAAAEGGVFHCFAENAEFAARLREINFIVSFPGILTFKKSDQMRAIAAAIPLDSILIETDAPFLAPQPYRGKRCESAFVVETAAMLAAIHHRSLEEVAEITTANAMRFYRLGAAG